MPSRQTDYGALVKEHPDSVQSLILLANIYNKGGKHEDAIAIYLALLDVINEKSSRIELLLLLGKTYYKAGFMQRSRDILLECLELRARNKPALEQILVIFEQLKSYDEALEVIDALEEMGESIHKERAVIKALKVIGDAKKSLDVKIEGLEVLLRDNPVIARIALEFMFRFDKKAGWRNLSLDQVDEMMEILWNLKAEDLDATVIAGSERLQELYTAKGYLETVQESERFELDVLIKLGDKRKMADLSFEYTCSKCHAVFPLYVHRCPSCFEHDSCHPDPVLIKAFPNEFRSEFV